MLEKQFQFIIGQFTNESRQVAHGCHIIGPRSSYGRIVSTSDIIN